MDDREEPKGGNQDVPEGVSPGIEILAEYHRRKEGPGQSGGADDC